MDGRTDRHRDGSMDKPKPICSPLFQIWGHKKDQINFKQLKKSGDMDLCLNTIYTES